MGRQIVHRAVFLVVVASLLPPANAGSRPTLTFEERVAAQTAIERVYWAHRIWPVENPGPKPPLEAVMSEAVIRAKVERSIRASDALEGAGRPITAAALQAEMERMAQRTKQPELLRELFAVLDNDPAKIAECIARPALADRLSQGSLAFDEQSAVASRELSVPNGPYHAVTITGSCTDDTWQPTGNAPPTADSDYSIVWTGTEMIVWGGLAGASVLTNEGGRYNLATDTWSSTALPGAPSPRGRHSAVWTGTEMVIWGGGLTPTNFQGTNTGGHYNPASDSWAPTEFTGAPTARAEHLCVWTGSEMIVWSGRGQTGNLYLNTGARYNPASQTWTTTGTVNAPAGRQTPSAVWTGSRMIVWGGYFNGMQNTGALYDPVANTWAPTSTTDAPLGRQNHKAVWTGSEMIVWGGNATLGNLTDTGGRYNPASDTWTGTETIGAPSIRGSNALVWTGTRMLVWGGITASNQKLTDGALYNPATDGWTATSAVNAPAGGIAAGVLAGSDVLLWASNAASRYGPASDSWIPVNNFPPGRGGHTAVWTGTEMIVWGGGIGGPPYDGALYDPALDSWTRVSFTGAPNQASNQIAVWTGVEMIVAGSVQTQGRYNPASDSWASMSTVNIPSDRFQHVGVWTGAELILWGGGSFPYLQTGGRYNPSANTWTATSLSGAPLPRILHTAVWTGSRMIVWGGFNGSTGFGDGASYDPLANAWTAVPSTGAPGGRYYHTSVWTGSEMIVWGGIEGGTTSTGARFNPTSNQWTALPPLTNSQMLRHTAVWTGELMVAWGGAGVLGGRYHPATNSWSSVSTVNRPASRVDHTAIWTGDEMIVWGGSIGGTATRSGGRYCADCTVTSYYRDADNDGHGLASNSVLVCGPAPAGYVASSNDCSDTQGSVYPGAPQLCDGLNNDCNSPAYPTPPANEANADADGFRICAGDCDDTRSSVRPGGTQLCDGLNNNCSDPSWPTVPANEADADADGSRICAGDCNDANPAIKPGAAEVCNAIDDDCDSQTDEDAQGVDSDGDGVRNACDNCRFSSNVSQLDSDGDQVGNACDNCIAAANQNQADGDGDGTGTVCDNCPINANANQNDVDADRVGDACDNCPFDSNTPQSDANHDGEGDVCDTNDGQIHEFREDKTSISWQAEQGPTSWNVYIGDLSVLKGTGVYTQVPGSNALADRHCGETSTFVSDLGQPAAGEASFSLVTGAQGGLEGSLGNSTTGPRPNANPCP